MNVRILRHQAKKYWRKNSGKFSRVLFAIIVSLLYALLSISPLGIRLESTSTPEFLYMIRDPRQAPEKFVIIAMDDESYENFKLSRLSLWPRELHAKLLERLAPVNPERVVMDIFFYNEPSTSEADERLARAMKGVPTVFTNIADSVSSEITNEGPGKNDQHPFPLFLESALRTVPADVIVTNGIVQQIAFPQSGRIPMAEALMGILRPGNSLPEPGDLIHYYGPPGTIKTIPYYDALSMTDSVFKDTFGEKIVFVGRKSSEKVFVINKDSFLTPASAELMPGVEIHATIAANLLQGDWIERKSSREEISVLSIVCFLLAYCLTALRPLVSFLLLVTATFLWIGLAVIAFHYNLWVPGVTLFFVVLPLSFAFASVWLHLRSSARTRQLYSALGIESKKTI